VTKQARPVGSGEVFRDLGFSDEEAAVLSLKSYLFIELEEAIAENLQQTNQNELAVRLGTTQPIISNIANGKISGFTLDRIIELLLKLNRDVHVSTAVSRRDRRRGAVILNKLTGKKRRAVC
jgi:predicted XRE-type DNA-binding protein